MCNLPGRYLRKGPVQPGGNEIDTAAFAGESVQIADVPTDPRVRYKDDARREGLASGLCVPLGYLLLIGWAGFPITPFVFLFVGMLALNRGRSPGLIAALAAVMSLGGYLLFILAFDTRFPRGPFETFMKAMLGDGV